MLPHYVSRHTILAADFLHDRIHIQSPGHSLPDSCAGPITYEYAASGDVQESESIRVERSPNVIASEVAPRLAAKSSE